MGLFSVCPPSSPPSTDDAWRRTWCRQYREALLQEVAEGKKRIHQVDSRAIQASMAAALRPASLTVLRRS